MADYVKRDYSGSETEMPHDYYKLEIESYDPSHIHFNYRTGYTKSNAIEKLKDDIYYFTGSNQNNQFIVNTTYPIQESGDYRVCVFCYTVTQPETLSLKINNRQIGNPVSVQSRDIFMRKLDFGIQNISKGNIPIQVTCGGHVGFITVYLMKVRLTSGDSEGNGILTIKKAKVTLGRQKQADTLDLTIKHEDRSYSENGFKEPGNSTGLIFEYRDSVNLYGIDENGELIQVFGGYASSPLLSDNKMSISIPCAGRLKDGDRRHVLKQLTVGGAESTVTNLTYNAKTLYDALEYICQNVELPLQIANLAALRDEIPYKEGYNIDYSKQVARDKLTIKNLSKSKNNSSVTLRNNYKKNQYQWAILWDSSWNKLGENTGYKITDTPVFYIKYGLGEPVTTKNVKVWVPKQYTKTKKVKKGTGVWKTVKQKTGYDASKPFQGYIEIQYSTSPGAAAPRKNITIDFTANDNSAYNMGEIEPILKNNTLKIGELDVISILQVMDPSTNYYWRRLAFKYTTPSGNDLYDPKNETTSNKMVFYKAGFRSGQTTTPEVLQSSGQKCSDVFYSIHEKLKLNMHVKYAKDRKDDKIVLSKPNSQVSLIEFKQGLGGNVLEVVSIKYEPINDMKNAVIKIYKSGNNTNNYVASKNVESIFRFGEDQDVEVLNDEVGAEYAKYLAKTDEDKNMRLSHTYTLKIKGCPNVHIGELVISTLDNSIYNDLQPVESLEIEIDPGSRPAVITTAGMGEMNPQLRSKISLAQVRKNIQTKRTAFAGGAVEAEYIDLF